jgi:hypothetical protein
MLLFPACASVRVVVANIVFNVLCDHILYLVFIIQVLDVMIQCELS